MIIIGIIFCIIVDYFTFVMCKSAQMADDRMIEIMKGK